MNRYRAGILVMTAALLIARGENAPEAEAMLQAAQQKETLEGDLKGAIKQYSAIATKYARTDRGVTASALVRMAECHQKMGGAESRKIYEQILREYADQKEAVATARARLGAESGTSRNLTFRQVWKVPDQGTVFGTTSRDGRYLPYVEWGQYGDLFLHDFSTGLDRRLTNTATNNKPGRKVPEFADDYSFSPDSRQLVYAWFKGDHNRHELRVIDLKGDGIAQPRLLFDNPDVDWIGPTDWSPDGKWIAVRIQRTDKTAQIGLVSIPDGSLRVLKSVDWRGAGSMFFSPDGKYLGYDVPESDTSEQRDVFVLAIDGTREIPAVVHGGEDKMMGWSPDGSRLLFVSDRTGSLSLWGLPFADGKPQGKPELIKGDIGRAQSIGMTRSGALYYLGTTGGDQPSGIRVAGFDLRARKLISPATEIKHDYFETHNSVRWTPDGKYLAYVSQRIGPGAADRYRRPVPVGDTLVIRSADTYQVIRELRVKLSYLYSLRWLPGGRYVLAIGADLKGRSGVFQVDAQTGDVSPVRLDQPGQRLRYFSLSPDGKSLYSSYFVPDGSVLFQRDLASGVEKELLRRPNLVAEPVSPDGQYIALLCFDPSSNSGVKLLLPTAGGEPREVMRVPSGHGPISASWAPDSRSFFTLKLSGDGQRDNEVWQVPIDGGAPVKLDGVTSMFDVHPDGQRIVYSVSEALPRKQEVWVLDNFLPRH